MPGPALRRVFAPLFALAAAACGSPGKEDEMSIARTVAASTGGPPVAPAAGTLRTATFAVG